PPAARHIRNHRVGAKSEGTDIGDGDPGHRQHLYVPWIAGFGGYAGTDFVDLVRTEDVGVIEVSEISPLHQGAIERRPNAARLCGVFGPDKASVDLILTRTQFVIDADGVLSGSAEGIGDEIDIADIEDTVGGADSIGSRRGASQVAESRGG